MQTLKKVHILHSLLTLSLFFFKSTTQHTETSFFCGKIRIQTPFVPQNPVESSILNHMVLCKSQKLYFRTSIGLFPISSINYTSKLLTISHTTCSSSLNFLSASRLSAGFPRLPQPNSLLLFNCSNQTNYKKSLGNSCTTSFHGCKKFNSCLLVDDLGEMEKGFHPKDLNCSHYTRVYKKSLGDDDDDDDDDDKGIEGFELGTRISFDIPDHVPNICDECTKPNGNCGAGLRCICHPKECKDKVISIATTTEPFDNILFSLLSFTVAIIVLNVS